MEDADRILEILEENEGTFPKMEPGEKKEGPHGMSAEIPYESRYFSVLFDANGTIILTDTSKIASIDTETAADYASEVWSKGPKKDFWMITDIGNVLLTTGCALFFWIADGN